MIIMLLVNLNDKEAELVKGKYMISNRNNQFKIKRTISRPNCEYTFCYIL